MRPSIFAYEQPGYPVKKVIVREIIFLVVMAVLVGIVWFVGNHAIEFYYRPQIQKVQQDIDLLKRERAGLFAKLHQEKVRLFLKVFTERYDPRQDDTMTEEQLVRIYNRYAADDTKFLTYLFKNYIPDYSCQLHKEEIEAFKEDLSGQAAALTDRVMRPYTTGSRDLLAVQDENFKGLYRMYWVHTILILVILAVAYPVRGLVKLYRWGTKTYRVKNIRNF